MDNHRYEAWRNQHQANWSLERRTGGDEVEGKSADDDGGDERGELGGIQERALVKCEVNVTLDARGR